MVSYTVNFALAKRRSEEARAGEGLLPSYVPLDGFQCFTFQAFDGVPTLTFYSNLGLMNGDKLCRHIYISCASTSNCFEMCVNT